MIKNGKKKAKRYVLTISMSETAIRPWRRADFRCGRTAVSDSLRIEMVSTDHLSFYHLAYLTAKWFLTDFDFFF